MSMNYEKCTDCEFVIKQQDIHRGLPEFKCKITGEKISFSGCVKTDLERADMENRLREAKARPRI